MKDKHGVTTQTASFQAPRGVTPLELAERARGVGIDGVTIADATPHENKLKPGHSLGNRFSIALRELDEARLPEVTAALAANRSEGVPNAFGRQRYGTRGDNVARALAWLRGEERGPGIRGACDSVVFVQSAVFDGVAGRPRRRWARTSRPHGRHSSSFSTSGGSSCAPTQRPTGAAADTGEVSLQAPSLGRGCAGRRAKCSPSRKGSASALGESVRLGAGPDDSARERECLCACGYRNCVGIPPEGNRSETAGHRGVMMWVYFVLTKGA